MTDDINWKAEWEAVCSERIKDRQRSQEIINERDAWIAELTAELKEAQAETDRLKTALSLAEDDKLVMAHELKEALEHLTRCIELVPEPGAIEAAESFLAKAQGGE